MEIPPSVIWLTAGALLMAFEAIVFPGIGFLFAGLGAITVGAALGGGVIENLNAQFILFFLSTGVWTAVLWKPLKKFLGDKGSGFDDMVGSTAVVFGDALEKGKTGQVRWSGTIMKCRLDPELEAPETVPPGTEVTIAGVSQGILLVKSRSTK